jgi:hypothetical protein
VAVNHSFTITKQFLEKFPTMGRMKFKGKGRNKKLSVLAGGGNRCN